MKQVVIYTDGACSGNPGPGGWGAVLSYNGHQKEISGFVANTTNNRMELMAVDQGLRALKEYCEVHVFTDSAYIHNAFDKGWLIAWQYNSWRKPDKSEVKNQDLWKSILNLMKGHCVYFHKVKGHADDKLNNRCDELARAQIKRHKNKEEE